MRAGAGEADADAFDPFRALGGYVTARGFDIWPVAAPYVTDDELKVLGWLTYFKRAWADAVVVVDPELSSILAACARCLADRGVRLPFRVAQRVAACFADEVFSTRPPPLRPSQIV